MKQHTPAQKVLIKMGLYTLGVFLIACIVISGIIQLLGGLTSMLGGLLLLAVVVGGAYFGYKGYHWYNRRR